MPERGESQYFPASWDEITPEQRSERKKTDFVQLFRDRIAAIEPVPTDEQARRAEKYAGVGIDRLQREAPALVFDSPKGQDLEIWTQDYKALDAKYANQPHFELIQWLAEYTGMDEEELQWQTFKNAAYVLEDDKGLLYLLIDDMRAEGISSTYLENDEEALKYLNMLRRYGISKVIGKFRTPEQKRPESYVPAHAGNAVSTFIDDDVIGRVREEAFYVNLAQENGLSNSDFLRMRAVSKSAKEAGTSFDAIAYAKELREGNRES